MWLFFANFAACCIGLYFYFDRCSYYNLRYKGKRYKDMFKIRSIDFHPASAALWKGYSMSRLKQDVIAGIVVGIIAIPLAIAFAIASGVSPAVGLITAIIGGFMVSAFGGNSVQIGGPTGAFIVIIYNIIAMYGLQGLAMATFMAGCILVLLGLFRLGSVIKFIPYPIVVGFTAGIAVTIFSTQMPDFFGLSISESVPGDFIGKWGCICGILTLSMWLPFWWASLRWLLLSQCPRFQSVYPVRCRPLCLLRFCFMWRVNISV